MNNGRLFVILVSILSLVVILCLYPGHLNPLAPRVLPSININEYRLLHHACKFTIPNNMNVDCATLFTPKQSGSFELPVAIVRYTGLNKRHDPVFYLQGGPGAKAGIDTQSIEDWQYFMENADLQRDIIVMDRRGVGASKPALTCTAFDRFSEKILQENLTIKQEMLAGKEILSQCFNNSRYFNIEHYGTTKNAEDLHALIDNLYYPRWNLVGVSYGTRLALEFIKQNKNNITKNLNALVLDSVYPAQVGGFDAWPKTLVNAIEGFYSACASYTPCETLWGEVKNNFTEPQLPQAFTDVLAMLKKKPSKLTVYRYNETPVDVIVDDELFLSAVFSKSYSHRLWPDIVSAMNAVKINDRKKLQKFMGDYLQQALSDSVSSLVFMAVDCQDNLMGTQEAYNLNVNSAGNLSTYVEGLWKLQVCHQWPETQSALKLNANTLMAFKKPTLILAGDHDPITPKVWADKIAKLLPNPQFKVFKNTGHAVLWASDCALEGLGRYLDSPESNWQVCN